jgi:hypothetical protein
MTARPSFPECRRRLVRVAVALCIMMVAVLLAAGCIGHSDNKKSAVNDSLLVTINPLEQLSSPTPMTTIGESQCQQMENDSTIISGYPFMYNGTVPHSGISTVRMWIFMEKMLGTWSEKSQSLTYRNTNNYDIISVPVQSDTFNFSFTGNQTKELGAGNYRIIFQYPKSGNTFDIRTQIDQNREEVYDKQGGLLINIRNVRQQKMNSFDAADILEHEINKPGSGDTSNNFTLVIRNPIIRVNPVYDHHLGEIFFINGTTNLPAGEKLVVEIDICCPLQTKGFIIPPHFKSTVLVQPGCRGNNSWSVLVNSSGLYPNRPEQDWMVAVYNPDLVGVGYANFNISVAQNLTPIVIQSSNSTTNMTGISQ